MMTFKQRGHRRQRQGRRVPVQEEQDRRASRHRPASLGAGKVEVNGEDGKTQTVETKNIVIATGSDVARLQGRRRSTRSASCRRPARSRSTRCRASCWSIGAGVIGLELGSVWRRLGAQVTVVEFLDRILPGMDGEVAKQFQRMLEKQGVDVPARRQGHRRRRVGQDAQGAGRGRGGRRQAGDDRGGRGAGRHRPHSLHRRRSA